VTNLFIAYVAAFFVPLLFHSWRIAVLGLGVQGLLLALILAAHEHPWSPQLAFEYASLFLIRAVFIPWSLFRRMKGHEMPSDFSLISKNLIQWTIAFLLLVEAFIFGDKMSPDDPHEAMQIGTAAGSILIGLLVLANQTHPLGQIVGLLMLEGGFTLVELLSPHAMPFPVSMGVSFVVVIFVLTCGQYLSWLQRISPESHSVEDNVVL
jgi:hydrogenase-4 membrane subunit HyfE